MRHRNVVDPDEREQRSGESISTHRRDNRCAADRRKAGMSRGGHVLLRGCDRTRNLEGRQAGVNRGNRELCGTHPSRLRGFTESGLSRAQSAAPIDNEGEHRKHRDTEQHYERRQRSALELE